MAKADQQDGSRWIDDPPGPREAKIAAHLRNFPPPASFSRTQVATIAARLAAEKDRRRAAPWLWVATGAAVAMVTLVIAHPWSYFQSSTHIVDATPPAWRTLPHDRREWISIGSARVLLVGPASVSQGASLQVKEGDLRVVTDAHALQLETPDGRITIHPRARVEVSVRSFHSRIAAYSGSTTVTWQDFQKPVEIGAGIAATQFGVSSINLEEKDEAFKRFEEGAAPRVFAPPVTAPPTTPKPIRERAAPRVDRARPAVAIQTTLDARTVVPESVVPAVAEVAERKTTPPTESAIGAESRLLQAALEKLHQTHDAEAALRLLDAHRARFSSGQLLSEAQRIRLEALLKLGRGSDALILLDHDRVVDGDLELTVTRAELRSGANRCPEARRDFSWALERAGGLVEERARFGLAECNAKLGESAVARAQLADYLAHFPKGRFAEAAKRTLAK